MTSAICSFQNVESFLSSENIGNDIFMCGFFRLAKEMVNYSQHVFVLTWSDGSVTDLWPRRHRFDCLVAFYPAKTKTYKSVALGYHSSVTANI